MRWSHCSFSQLIVRRDEPFWREKLCESKWEHKSKVHYRLSASIEENLPMLLSFYSFRDAYRWLFTLISLHHIHGHGRMEEPPARNTAWRHGQNWVSSIFILDSNFSYLGFDVPVNYDDIGLNCGGLSIQRANSRHSPRLILKRFRSCHDLI